METPIVHRINFFLTDFTESRAVDTVSVMNDVISSGIFEFMSQCSSMFFLECIVTTYASVDEIREGGGGTGRAAPEKTSDVKVERNIVNVINKYYT